VNELFPRDVSAEQAIVGAALISVDFLDRVIPIVTPEQFYSDVTKQVYEALRSLREAGVEYDAVVVKGWLEDRGKLQRIGGAKTIAEFVNEVPMQANVEQLALRVRDKWRLRQIITTCRKVAVEAQNENVSDPDEFIDGAEREILAATQRYEVIKPARLKDVIRERFKALQSGLAQTSAVRTGLLDVDAILAGLQPGDLCYLAARPGKGKTSLALNNMAVSTAERNIGVGVFSLEMPREQLVDRVTCSGARVDSQLLRTNKLDAEGWSRLSTECQRLGKLPIDVDDESSISLASLRAKARRMAAGFKRQGTPLGLVVIDYLQLMATDPKLKSRDEKVGENSKGLKALAKDLGVVVLCLSQLNRDVEKRGKSARPQLSDLRESGNIEQDADEVIFIHPSSDSETVQHIIVAKNRNGATGSTKVAWQKVYTRFDDLADYDEPGPRGGGW